MIPTNSLAQLTGSGNVGQSITQSNTISASNSGRYGGAFADNNVQTNFASNSAFVNIVTAGGAGGSGNVGQFIGQSNSITATNTGDNGKASASGNTQINAAANVASVGGGGNNPGSTPSTPGPKEWVVGNNGGKQGGISHSGNVGQFIGQSNSITATNTGDNGKASASGNTQINAAANVASVHIQSSGNNNGKDWVSGKGNHDSGSQPGISQSGNVHQSISQSNSIDASNSGTGGSATADNNHQSNTASNSATVHISSNSGGHDSKGSKHTGSNDNNNNHKHRDKISHSGNVDQSTHQSNSVSSNNSGDHGSSSSSGNSQSNSGSNSAHTDSSSSH